MYASSIAALGAGFILDTRVCCYDPDLVASYHAAAPSALATAVRLLGLRPGDLLVAGGGLPRPAHWLPCCTAECCVPTPGKRMGTGLSLPPWLLPPCSGFTQCKKRTPGSGAPPPLPQSLWLYFPY